MGEVPTLVESHREDRLPGLDEREIRREVRRRSCMGLDVRVVATEERDYVSGRFPAEIWEINAEEWRARKR